MKKLIYSVGVALAICLGASSDVQAQCAGTILAQQNCASPGTQVANNDNLNTGVTRWYTGTGSVTGVNFNGGTLVVCGSLTLTFGSVNSGNIIVQPGASLTVSGAVSFNNSFNITNYGSVSFNGDVTLQNSNNTLANATSSATMNFNSNNLTLNGTGSAVINNGGIGGISLLSTANGNGTVCMGQNATMAVANITNTGNSHTLFSLGTSVTSACLRLTGTYAQGHPGSGSHNPLSATSSLKLCIPGSSSSSALGSNTVAADIVATINTSCTSCLTIQPLPLQLISFSAEASNNGAMLSFVTANEKNIASFEIERSTDGKVYGRISEKIAPSNIAAEHAYYWNDAQPAAGMNYYRIKISELDGSSNYSGTAVINNGKSQATASVFPNPAQDKINIRIDAVQANTAVSVSVEDMTGRRLYQSSALPGSGVMQVNIDNWQSGIYLVRTVINGQANVYRFVKS